MVIWTDNGVAGGGGTKDGAGGKNWQVGQEEAYKKLLEEEQEKTRAEVELKIGECHICGLKYVKGDPREKYCSPFCRVEAVKRTGNERAAKSRRLKKRKQL